MNLQKIQWKMYFQNPEASRPDDFFRVFNTWIPDSPEIFVDVADYQHVHDGPVTFLAGHDVDYALDDTDRRRGFLYARKQPLAGENVIGDTFAAFIKACIRLISDPLFGGELRLKTDEILFVVNDRALAPNTEDTFKGIKPELEKFFSRIFPKGFMLKHRSDPKQRFSVEVHQKEPLPIDELLKRIKVGA